MQNWQGKIYRKNYESYLEMVKDGKHLCIKCGRVGKKNTYASQRKCKILVLIDHMTS